MDDTIFILCCDAGEPTPLISADANTMACADTFNDAVDILRESRGTYPCFSFIFELRIGQVGVLNRWEYNPESGLVEPWEYD